MHNDRCVSEMERVSNGALRIVRDKHLAEKVVVVNGQPGCGKTMLSPFIAALDRVELLTYAYELEHICSLYFMQRIEHDAAVAMVRMLTDLQLYNTMMAREVNFRPSDLSGVFRDARPGRYVRRLFQEGDEAIPDRIRKERPILHLTTHNLLPFSEPIFAALGERVVFIEVVRHPLYMIKQQVRNMEYLFIDDARDFTVYFSYQGRHLPYFVRGWEELFVCSNAMEKAIYSIEQLNRMAQEQQGYLAKQYNAKILVVPFERFVVEPWPYMEQIEHKMGTRMTRTTRRMMKKQRVPRKMYAEGINLKIYRRCGWECPRAGSDENREFEIRRQFAAQQVSSQAMQVLDKLCAEYEEEYIYGRRT